MRLTFDIPGVAPGTYRETRRFLWAWLRLGGQWRWLEMATIKQVAVASSITNLVFGVIPVIEWHDVKFVD